MRAKVWQPTRGQGRNAPQPSYNRLVSTPADREDAVEIRLLGPFEVVRNGSAIGLGTRKQRAVLALLALEPNSAIPTERLIDALWGEDPPASARAVLQTYVAGLRKGLDRTGIEVATRGTGYALEVDSAFVDAERFRALVGEARELAGRGDRATAVETLREALALWRGRPLEEFHPEPGLAVAAERLEAQRLGATEERIEGDLAVGSSSGLVDELEALVAEHPYRERLRGQLMRALYLDGRQGEALEAYRDARRRLADDLGIEPGPDLRALERAVLEHDPVLDAPRVGPASTQPSPGRRIPQRSFVVALAALLVAAAATAGAIVALAGDDAQRVDVPPNSVAVIDPATNDVIDTVQVGIRPGPITAGDGSVWAGNLDDRNLTRIDVRLRRPAGTVSLEGRTPTGLAFDRAMVWVAHGLLGSVSLVDAQFESVASVTEVTEKGAYSSAGTIAAGSGAIWAVFGDATLARLERTTGDVVETTRTDASPVGVTVGYGSVWVASAHQSAIQRFSPLSLAKVDSLNVGTRPGAIVAGFGDVWVTSTSRDLVYRVDIGEGSISAAIPVGDGPTAIAVAAAAVWVANTDAGTVDRIDPEKNEVVETIDVGEAPAGLVAAGSLLWVTMQAR